MGTYDHSVELSGHFYHQTLYVHSAIEIDGSMRVVSRNESIDRLSSFMSRFWDRHPSFYESWGCRASSSICPFDSFPHKGKRKGISSSSVENFEWKIRRVQSVGDTFVDAGECDASAGSVEGNVRVGDIF